MLGELQSFYYLVTLFVPLNVVSKLCVFMWLFSVFIFKRPSVKYISTYDLSLSLCSSTYLFAPLNLITKSCLLLRIFSVFIFKRPSVNYISTYNLSRSLFYSCTFLFHLRPFYFFLSIPPKVTFIFVFSI